MQVRSPNQILSEREEFLSLLKELSSSAKQYLSVL